ncbi:microtubule-associated protein futsch-like [Quillaja saponaria]|uniref:Microtubule-associated protein futsch-like n=1 Tax=Quillaja saponaria TaxID=32244 RepID=A0AAD7LH27_QUISA|nr:microtubule-associated protein futsch-like [Quillaja saponaria]
MGGCATKPKVLKDDAGKEVKVPEPAKEETPVTVTETKRDIVDVNVEQSEEVKEIVDDDKVDEEGSKRRSLTQLFNEKNEDGRPENEKAPVEEPAKQELIETEKTSEKSEGNPSVKHETSGAEKTAGESESNEPLKLTPTETEKPSGKSESNEPLKQTPMETSIEPTLDVTQTEKAIETPGPVLDVVTPPEEKTVETPAPALDVVTPPEEKTVETPAPALDVVTPPTEKAIETPTQVSDVVTPTEKPIEAASVVGVNTDSKLENGMEKAKASTQEKNQIVLEDASEPSAGQ